MAAFQSLGGFIAIFAEPQLTGLRLADDETIVYDESTANSSNGRYLGPLYVKIVKFIYFSDSLIYFCELDDL